MKNSNFDLMRHHYGALYTTNEYIPNKRVYARKISTPQQKKFLIFINCLQLLQLSIVNKVKNRRFHSYRAFYKIQ